MRSGFRTTATIRDYLEVNPDEFTELFDTLLINVTGFFRDQAAWDFLQDDVLPKLLGDTPDDQPIRVWSAACASGQDAYTAAMVLSEVLGEDEFRRRAKIYATDVDEPALSQARAALYSRADAEAVPAALREKYWEPAATGLVFRPDLRRSVIFGRNDLVRDAPISRIDLLISRNALMYFTPDTQAHILTHFNFSLDDTGFLFLGKSEMLLSHGELFSSYSLKWRIFKRVPRTGIRDRIGFIAPALRGANAEIAERYAQLRDAAADTAPIAQIVIDARCYLAYTTRAARSVFGLGPAAWAARSRISSFPIVPSSCVSGSRAADEQRAAPVRARPRRHASLRRGARAHGARSRRCRGARGGTWTSGSGRPAPRGRRSCEKARARRPRLRLLNPRPHGGRTDLPGTYPGERSPCPGVRR